MESERAVDGRGITGLFGSMVGKLSSLERIDREGDPFCLLFLFAILSRKDPYDHIGSIAEKVFLSWTRSQRTAIFLLRTQRLTKKMGNHPHEDQKTHSNALKSPKD